MCECIYRARLLAVAAVPAGSAAAGSIRWVAFGPVCTSAGGVAPPAPGSLRAGGGAFHTPPTLVVNTAVTFQLVAGGPLFGPPPGGDGWLGGGGVKKKAPSLQKQAPSMGEQSMKLRQEHSREQFFP